MDLPEAAVQIISLTLSPEPAAAVLQRRGSRSAGLQQQLGPAAAGAWRHRLLWLAAVLSHSTRLFVEEFWLQWGAECVMLLLLVAACVSANALSLAYLLLVGMGMAMTGAAAARPAAVQSADAACAPGSQRGSRSSSSGRRQRSAAAGGGWWWRLVLAVLVLVLVSCGMLALQHAALAELLAAMPACLL